MLSATPICGKNTENNCGWFHPQSGEKTMTIIMNKSFTLSIILLVAALFIANTTASNVVFGLAYMVGGGATVSCLNQLIN